MSTSWSTLLRFISEAYRRGQIPVNNFAWKNVLWGHADWIFKYGFVAGKLHSVCVLAWRNWSFFCFKYWWLSTRSVRVQLLHVILDLYCTLEKLYCQYFDSEKIHKLSQQLSSPGTGGQISLPLSKNMLKSAFYTVLRPQDAKNCLRRIDCCYDRGWQLDRGDGIRKIGPASLWTFATISCIAYSRGHSNINNLIIW